MSSLSSLVVSHRSPGVPLDPIAETLEAVAVHGGRLFVAMLTPQDSVKLATALRDAKTALARAEAGGGALVEALQLASDEEIERELIRLVRSWPQDKRGDLAGYAAELGTFVVERQPSRRAMEQACRSLKLRRVHMPSIAEVMDALAAAEGTIAAATQQLVTLPDRIARAEAALQPKRAGVAA